MTVIPGEEGRKRAWILVQAEAPELAAQQLYEALGWEGGDSFVLIRVDVVDHYFNLVIPVDAESWDVLHEVASMIQQRTRAKEMAILPVVEHHPKPPHLAHGYVTPQEAEAGGIETWIGRVGDSPGNNCWG